MWGERQAPFVANPTEDVGDLILLLLGADAAAGRSRLAGVTRLQKLLFLITRDPRYQSLVHSGQAPDLTFEPYKMGPFTPDVYEGVEALVTFQPPLLHASIDTSGLDTLESARYVDELDLDARGPRTNAAYRPMQYQLTAPGKRVADALWTDAPQALRAVVTEVVARYGRLPLRELLRRVYTEHPEMTIRSEIRNSLGLI